MELVQKGGRAYVSNATVKGRFALRACITNFRTTKADIDETVEAVREGAFDFVSKPFNIVELKGLVEAAGTDFVGVCIDSGNPVWTIEDPHLTLDTLAPYVLTSHMRDSALWRAPEGIADVDQGGQVVDPVGSRLTAPTRVRSTVALLTRRRPGSSRR